MVRRLLPLLLSAAALLGASAGPSSAQAPDDGPVAVVDSTTGGLRVELGRYLRDEGLRRALHSGLPVRMEVRVELWRDGFFDQQDDGGTWRASVVYDAVTQTYEVAVGEGEAESFASLEMVGEALQEAFHLEVRPRESGRYYFLAEVELETLSLSDLEELSRWLKGDLGPVVSGERPAETAVTKGLRRIMVRALGLPARRERLRTPTFPWPLRDGG